MVIGSGVLEQCAAGVGMDARSRYGMRPTELTSIAMVYD